MNSGMLRLTLTSYCFTADRPTASISGIFIVLLWYKHNCKLFACFDHCFRLANVFLVLSCRFFLVRIFLLGVCVFTICGCDGSLELVLDGLWFADFVHFLYLMMNAIPDTTGSLCKVYSKCFQRLVTLLYAIWMTLYACVFWCVYIYKHKCTNTHI